ncbi:hypothetical protein CLU79DRAFT_744686 [Phycomyces nitens]|nr:hypothetical protein CLU79DRAFT_744686 [Phycomyces nitens]
MKFSFISTLLLLVVATNAADTSSDEPLENCIEITYPVNGSRLEVGSSYTVTWNVIGECTFPKSLVLGYDYSEDPDYFAEIEYTLVDNLDIAAGSVDVFISENVPKDRHIIAVQSTTPEFDDIDSYNVVYFV